MPNAQEHLNHLYQNVANKFQVKKINFPSLELEGSLNLQDLKGVEEINVENNRITSIDASKCYNLRRINIERNPAQIEVFVWWFECLEAVQFDFSEQYEEGDRVEWRRSHTDDFLEKWTPFVNNTDMLKPVIFCRGNILFWRRT